MGHNLRGSLPPEEQALLSARAALNREATARAARKVLPKVAKALQSSRREYYIDPLSGDAMPMGLTDLGPEIPWVPTY
jgi:hypothetical protein